MKIKLLFLSFFRNLSVFFFGLLLCQGIAAQELYIGANAEFHLSKDAVFSTNNTVVQVDNTGVFSVESGNNWGSETEFVQGLVKGYGTGITKLPVGDNGVYAPVLMDHTGDVSALYSNQAPSDGTNGTDVDAVSNVEFWELTGNAVITLPWNENSNIASLVNDNGGSLNSVSIVGLNAGVWELVSAAGTNTITGDLLNGSATSDLNNQVDLNGFGQYTFGIDHQIVLAVNDLFLSAGISLLSNPIKAEEENVRFVTSGEIIDLKVSIYDINGRMVKHFNKVDFSLGEGNLPKSNLKSGLYFVKFEHNGKQGVKKIIIE